MAVAVLSLALAGCHSVFPTVPPSSAIRAPETPTLHYTALEGYDLIGTSMAAWHSDAFLANIIGIQGDAAKGWGVQPDGRLAYWVYAIASPSAGRVTEINLVDGRITVGIEGIPGEERELREGFSPLPVEEMIDSNEAIAVARAGGAVGDPVRITLGTYDPDSQRTIPLSWLFVYSPSPEFKAVHVYVDAIAGEIIRNEFAMP